MKTKDGLADFKTSQASAACLMFLATDDSYRPEIDCMVGLMDFVEDHVHEVEIQQFLVTCWQVLVQSRSFHSIDSTNHVRSFALDVRGRFNRGT